MKATVTDTKRGAIWGRSEVLVEATPDETTELRRALKIVDRFKKRAMRAAKTNEKQADWTMVGYAVKTDAVIVTIEQGACG